MTLSIYGPLARLQNDPKRVYPEPAFAKVAPLPLVDAPTPRRRRVFVCPHLRIDGLPVINFRPATMSGYTITTGKCTMRNVGIKGDLIGDLCGSSWAKSCCFLPEQEAA